MPSSKEHRKLTKDLPPGPLNATDVANHLPRLLNLVTEKDADGPLRMRRLRSLVENGLILHEDFAGRQSAAYILSTLQRALNLKHSWFINYRSSEQKNYLLKAIEKESNPLRPQHAYRRVEEINERRVDRQWYHDHYPDLSVCDYPSEEIPHLVEFHTQHHDYLKEKANAIFAPEMFTDTCILHPGSLCRCRREDHRDRREKGITLNWSGPVCNPWCAGSAKRGHAHKSIPSFNWFIMEARMFDFVMVEASDHQPPSHVVDELKDTHRVFYAYFGPEDEGFPVQRRRLHFGAIKHDRLVWLGSPGEDQTESFLQLFRSSALLDARVYAMDDDNGQRLFQNNLVKSHKYPVKHADLAYTDYELFSQHQRDHKQQYHNLAIKHYADSSDPYEERPFVVDVTSDPQVRPRMGTYIPSMVNSTRIISISADFSKADYHYTMKDLSFAMGWPEYKDVLFDQEFNRLGSNIDLNSMSIDGACGVLGQCWHLGSEESWFLYMATHMIRRELVETIFPPLVDSSIEELDPDNEENQDVQ